MMNIQVLFVHQKIQNSQTKIFQLFIYNILVTCCCWNIRFDALSELQLTMYPKWHGTKEHIIIKWAFMGGLILYNWCCLGKGTHHLSQVAAAQNHYTSHLERI